MSEMKTGVVVLGEFAEAWRELEGGEGSRKRLHADKGEVVVKHLVFEVGEAVELLIEDEPVVSGAAGEESASLSQKIVVLSRIIAPFRPVPKRKLSMRCR
jgi:hypothetical protein